MQKIRWRYYKPISRPSGEDRVSYRIRNQYRAKSVNISELNCFNWTARLANVVTVDRHVHVGRSLNVLPSKINLCQHAGEGGSEIEPGSHALMAWRVTAKYSSSDCNAWPNLDRLIWAEGVDDDVSVKRKDAKVYGCQSDQTGFHVLSPSRTAFSIGS